MARHYNILEEVLPTPSDRERDRRRIEKAITEYFSRGGSVQRVKADQHVNDPSLLINAEKATPLKEWPAPRAKKESTVLNETELARLLKAHCTAGSSLASAAATLGQTKKRCQTIARRYHIPFRSAAFSKTRART
ncbi:MULTISPECIES: hypothetical protein [Pseudomonas syringae group]|uniref:Uncharacterized protein n=4 Tax=Pseudomonas syringae group TaxID=136849 RepID=A0A9X0KXJ5_PSESX|nr:MULTISPECIES: hypothetical protein [Pseudomonas syringae group]EGH19939.1 hypothetical protein Pgy4_44177 [Pseudomonas savastanoi pv. glycinea str. race 4]KIY20060.1 hypothetical protein RD00_02480 [Pseudomonas amygdali pv. tabaci]KPX17553.1 hypothetical protein ALO73_200221 [Pseudomonas syringae pv. daphniphylli]KPX47721.1 hypothetical protein ALO37_200052 [Pseudomonas savastanoi pv. glycinea]KPY61302.1 Uncharacterized protein ALO93_02573 [Pseudomonas amygdali pv. sesami]